MDGLQSIPRESNDKDMVAMLDKVKIQANEESFVIVLQHGSNDVTWKQSIARQQTHSSVHILLFMFNIWKVWLHLIKFDWHLIDNIRSL